MLIRLKGHELMINKTVQMFSKITLYFTFTFTC